VFNLFDNRLITLSEGIFGCAGAGVYRITCPYSREENSRQHIEYGYITPALWCAICYLIPLLFRAHAFPL